MNIHAVEGASVLSIYVCVRVFFLPQRQKKLGVTTCVCVYYKCASLLHDPVMVSRQQMPRTLPQASASDMAAACNTRRSSQWLAGQTQPD